MRPITENERTLMQKHAESRIAGLSEISFIVRYYDNVSTPNVSLVQWEERGFFGDFRTSAAGNIYNIGNLGGNVYSSGAECIIPARYWEGLVVQNPAAPAAAQGKRFDIDLNGANYGNVPARPSAQWVKVIKIGGIEPHFQGNFLYKIAVEPLITADAIRLALEADTNITFLPDTSTGDLPKHGYYYNGTVHYGR